MRESAEILIDLPMVGKGQRMLEALADAAPPGSTATRHYSGQHRVLVIYGPGESRRRQIAKTHLQLGGRVVMWDLGYFDRPDGMRLSVDGMHPTPEQLLMSPLLGRRSFELREDADPAGPVLLVGLGEKSLPAYRLQPLQWERAAVERIRRRLPGAEIIWRPKGNIVRSLAGVRPEAGGTIEEALRGKSLVVCRHSNVGVDAALAGVPVWCDDGAAAALYSAGPNPTPAQRLQFLHRLSWWNWSPAEAAACWEWVRRCVGL